VIVDIDGTVALRGERDPYDTTGYHLDQPNPDVVWLVRSFIKLGISIHYVTGRRADHREITHVWLYRHQLVVDPGWQHLWMRPLQDDRPDTEVKADLYRDHIQTRYAVRFVLEDRARVVAMWRDLGLTCLQNVEGNY
jgi:hypothetical protein